MPGATVRCLAQRAESLPGSQLLGREPLTFALASFRKRDSARSGAKKRPRKLASFRYKGASLPARYALRFSWRLCGTTGRRVSWAPQLLKRELLTFSLASFRKNDSTLRRAKTAATIGFVPLYQCPRTSLRRAYRLRLAGWPASLAPQLLEKEPLTLFR